MTTGASLSIEFVPLRPLGGVSQQHASAAAHGGAFGWPLALLHQRSDRINSDPAFQKANDQLVGFKILVGLLERHDLAIGARRIGGRTGS